MSELPDRVLVVLDDARLGAPVEIGVLLREGKGAKEIVRFEYSPAWLEHARAFALDPELPLSPGSFFPSMPNALFGIFRDTAPDRWGRVLMERREAVDAGKEERKPRRLSEWSFLLGVSDIARMGALRLRDVDSPRSFLDPHALTVPPVTRLRELEAAALALDEPNSEERSEYEAWLRQLLAPGTSLGGARPKATFAEPDGSLWIAKFPGRQDRHDVGAWEFLAHELARRAGIHVPEAQRMRLGHMHHTFAAKRFDRVGKNRRLYTSAMSLLVKSDGDSGSYLEIAQAIQDHGDPQTLSADLAELYRRVVFNVLVGNRDDHLRNHGFLRGQAGWQLAPAFDVNPNPDKDDHTLALDETSTTPSIASVHATSDLYRLSRSRASGIEAEVRRALEDWQSIAKGAGFRREEIQRLETIVAPERP